MVQSKFDPNAAFKSIIGVVEIEEQRTDEMRNSKIEETMKEVPVTIIGNKEKEETRSKRVNLVVKPSVYTRAKKKCEGLNISLNECINQFLEKWSGE